MSVEWTWKSVFFYVKSVLWQLKTVTTLGNLKFVAIKFDKKQQQKKHQGDTA